MNGTARPHLGGHGADRADRADAAGTVGTVGTVEAVDPVDLEDPMEPLGPVAPGGRPGPSLVVLAGGRARRYGGVKPLAPVGPGGEAVLDLLSSDAIDAGFGRIVVVVGPSSGPAIRYHVRRCWPSAVDVHFAVQEVPLGTVDAVLTGLAQVTPRSPFGVCNADDLYGVEALRLLAAHLDGDIDAHPAAACSPAAALRATTDHAPAENVLVAFHLDHATVGGAPVTRGLCQVSDDGVLQAIEERRDVVPDGQGGFTAGDRRQPHRLDGASLVSMNLWGFLPTMAGEFRRAMAAARAAPTEAEVLLPEVVGSLVAGTGHAGGANAGGDGHEPAGDAVGGDAGDPVRFRVLVSPTRCVGVTHPSDLALVQRDLCRQVGLGERRATLWGAFD